MNFFLISLKKCVHIVDELCALKRAPGRQPSTQKKNPLSTHTPSQGAQAQKQRDAHELINAKEDEISHLFLCRARASAHSLHIYMQSR